MNRNDHAEFKIHAIFSVTLERSEAIAHAEGDEPHSWPPKPADVDAALGAPDLLQNATDRLVDELASLGCSAASATIAKVVRHKPRRKESRGERKESA